MNNKIIRAGQEADEVFTYEVSDRDLEVAAGTVTEKANFTLGACTGLSECPG